MAKYVDVNALLEKKTILWDEALGFCDCVLLEDIEATPAVEVVHGRWNADDWNGLRMRGFMACSACNVMIPTPDDSRYCLHRLNYCPNCGAKMDGDGNA